MYCHVRVRYPPILFPHAVRQSILRWQVPDLCRVVQALHGLCHDKTFRTDGRDHFWGFQSRCPESQMLMLKMCIANEWSLRHLRACTSTHFRRGYRQLDVTMPDRLLRHEAGLLEFPRQSIFSFESLAVEGNSSHVRQYRE